MPTYSAGIVSYNDMYMTMKRAASLLLNSVDTDDFLQKVRNDNALGLVSERDRIRKGSELAMRLIALDEQLLKWLAGDDINLGRQVNLYAILRRDRLFCEFMQEVYCDHHLAFIDKIIPGDVLIFLNRKAMDSDTVASWTDYVKKRLCREYIRILVRSGYGIANGVSMLISLPFIEPKLLQHLNDIGQADMAVILRGGVKG